MQSEKNSSFDDTYVKRRTVSAGEYAEVSIRDIGHINKSEIGIFIDVAEDKYLLKCSIDETFESPVGFALFISQLSDNYKEAITVEDIQGETIDLVFNSDMSKCGFEKEEYKFDIEYIENDNYEFSDEYSVDESIRKLLLWSEYQKSESIDGNDTGIKLEIDDVSEICENSFELTTFTSTGSYVKYHGSGDPVASVLHRRRNRV